MDMCEQDALDFLRRNACLVQCRARMAVFRSPGRACPGIDENGAGGSAQEEAIHIHLQRRLAPGCDRLLPCSFAIGMDQHISRCFEEPVEQKGNLILPDMQGMTTHGCASARKLHKKGRVGAGPFRIFMDAQAP